MMEELLALPVIGLLLLGVLVELEDLSYQASDRAVEFADDAVNALDCAFEARPLTECSPGITNAEYKAEIERTNALLNDIHTLNTVMKEHEATN